MTMSSEPYRRLAVLTTGRQDYGILRSTLLRLQQDARFELMLLVGGMHRDPRHGRTVQEIEGDGLSICELLGPAGYGASSDPAALFRPMFGALERRHPDATLLVGDRSEIAFSALACTLACVPIVHLHGGEETEGAIDNVLRHAITKLSHLHLVSCEVHARRVRQMGEPDDAVHVVGAPGLDNLLRSDLPSRAELEDCLGLPLDPPLVIVSYHPTTLAHDPAAEARAVLQAMAAVRATWLITLPNADAGSDAIRESFLTFARLHPRARAVEALGARLYAGALRFADALLGNSSSAIIEAPCLELPAINVGDRQAGRLRAGNVIDAPPESRAITDALAIALEPGFRRQLGGTSSPYGDGHSAPRIVDLLVRWQPPRPPRKAFIARHWV